MGLKFSELVLDPFLYNVFAIGFARIFAPSSKNLPEILSIPAAFEMLINCKTSKTLFSVVKFRLKLSFSSVFIILVKRIYIKFAWRIWEILK